MNCANQNLNELITKSKALLSNTQGFSLKHIIQNKKEASIKSRNCPKISNYQDKRKKSKATRILQSLHMNSEDSSFQQELSESYDQVVELAKAWNLEKEYINRITSPFQDHSQKMWDMQADLVRIKEMVQQFEPKESSAKKPAWNVAETSPFLNANEETLLFSELGDKLCYETPRAINSNASHRDYDIQESPELRKFVVQSPQKVSFALSQLSEIKGGDSLDPIEGARRVSRTAGNPDNRSARNHIDKRTYLTHLRAKYMPETSSSVSYSGAKHQDPSYRRSAHHIFDSNNLESNWSFTPGDPVRALGSSVNFQTLSNKGAQKENDIKDSLNRGEVRHYIGGAPLGAWKDHQVPSRNRSSSVNERRKSGARPAVKCSVIGRDDLNCVVRVGAGGGTKFAAAATAEEKRRNSSIDPDSKGYQKSKNRLSSGHGKDKKVDLVHQVKVEKSTMHINQMFDQIVNKQTGHQSLDRSDKPKDKSSNKRDYPKDFSDIIAKFTDTKARTNRLAQKIHLNRCSENWAESSLDHVDPQNVTSIDKLYADICFKLKQERVVS